MKQKLILIALFLALTNPAFAGDKAAKIQGYDTVTNPGVAVYVKAKLERVIDGLNRLGIRPDVEGERLRFFLIEKPGKNPFKTVELEEAELVGKAKTNSDGFASLEYTPKKEGLYVIEARLRKGSSYVALPGPLTIGVFKKNDPVILVDIDQCISDTSSLSASVTENKDIKAKDGAVEALSELISKQKTRIVYITAQDDDNINSTKSWMYDKKLPTGPIFFWDFWQKSWSEETYKTNLITKIRKTLPGADTGIGDHIDDAKAFISNGMTAHIINASKDEDLPALAVYTSAWSEIPKQVKEQRITEKLLKKFTNGSVVERLQAWNRMSRVGDGLLGFVARFQSSSDLNVSCSATLIMGRYKARKAFVKVLDTSTAERTLASLATAWRQGDSWIISQLYRQPAIAVNDCDPPLFPVGGIEILKRDDVSGSAVTYKIRVLPARKDKKPVVHKVKLVLLKDGTWRLETPDF
ncbi:MAG: hypothetical protein P1V97_23705 [Planctomycetota bacterium]|nr:hypothetical protein [Planctomycetota bacterium]